ncbi:MAG TPA: PAS domain-containing protein, partial [Cytophagaceae bacterium]
MQDFKTSVFVNGGEMGKRISEFDWSMTELGRISEWPLGLRSMVQNLLLSPAPLMLLWGKQGLKIYNDAYINIAGNRHPASLGNSVFDVWPEANSFLKEIFGHIYQGKTLSYKNLPFTINRNDKPEDTWFDLHYSPFYLEDNEVAGVFAVMAETTLQVQSEQRLNIALEATRDGVWEWDFINDKAWWDDRYSEIIGVEIPREERNLVSVSKYIHPYDRNLVDQALQDHLQYGKKFELDYRTILPSGEIRYLRAIGKSQTDNFGNIVKLTGTLRDITDSKHAELALKENEERYSLVLDAINDGIWDHNVLSGLVYWND